MKILGNDDEVAQTKSITSYACSISCSVSIIIKTIKKLQQAECRQE